MLALIILALGGLSWTGGDLMSFYGQQFTLAASHSLASPR